MNEYPEYLRESATPEIQRLLPQAPDTERAALSSLLLDPKNVSLLCEEKGITCDHFHLPAHATIYRAAMADISERGTTDLVLLTKHLRDRNELVAIGGAGYISEVYTYMPTATNAGYYLAALEEKRILREIITVGTSFASRCYEEQDDVPAVLDGLEKAVLAIRKSDDGELREDEPKDAVMRVCAKIEEYYERKGEVSGLTTGFPELDQMLDGMHAEEMIVIAARPSMGKTALGMNIAEHVAVGLKKTVAVFTLEMSIDQLYQRVVLSRARVNMHAVRKGFLHDGDFPKLSSAAVAVSEGSKLRVVDAIGATIGAIRAKARRMARKHPDLSLIVLDYIQKARSTSKQAQGNREREIAEISAGLKDLAKELKIPVVVLAQLNRDVEKRKTNGRPQLSDLRESGSIEQDADVVMLLYREERYAANEEELRAVEGKATLIVAKQRNGPVGDVPLTFLKEFARFESRARDVESEPRSYQQE